MLHLLQSLVRYRTVQKRSIQENNPSLMFPLADQTGRSCPLPGRAIPHHQTHPLVLNQTTQVQQHLGVLHVSPLGLITIMLHLQCTGNVMEIVLIIPPIMKH